MDKFYQRKSYTDYDDLELVINYFKGCFKEEIFLQEKIQIIRIVKFYVYKMIKYLGEK